MTEGRVGFPVRIGLRDPRSQKRELGHPSISPFDIAEGTSFVISLPTRFSESAARDDKGKGEASMKNAFHPTTKNAFYPATAFLWMGCPPLCHPERSRGICSSADPSWKCFSTERTRVSCSHALKCRHVTHPSSNRVPFPHP